MIGPSTLFAGYKTIKNMEKQGKERIEICDTLKEIILLGYKTVLILKI